MYKIVEKFDFLMQATRVLNLEKYDEFDVHIIYKWLNILSDKTLYNYNFSNIIPSYFTDLELLVDIINNLIKFYEIKEDYEKCDKLMKLKTKIKSMAILQIDN